MPHHEETSTECPAMRHSELENLLVLVDLFFSCAVFSTLPQFVLESFYIYGYNISLYIYISIYLSIYKTCFQGVHCKNSKFYQVFLV